MIRGASAVPNPHNNHIQVPFIINVPLDCSRVGTLSLDNDDNNDNMMIIIHVMMDQCQDADSGRTSVEGIFSRRRVYGLGVAFI